MKQKNVIDSQVFAPQSDGPISLSPACSPSLQRSLSDIVLKKVYFEDEATTIKPKRVLIVDDNAINLLVLKRLLKKIDISFIIDEASDGSEAISLCDTAQQNSDLYDVVFMDVEMPYDGYKATRFIRHILGITVQQMPIIACTSLASTEVKAKCLELGMNAYLPKPINYGLLKIQLKLVTNVLLEKTSLATKENYKRHKRLSATL